jgi:hypothetical protein
LNIDVAGRGVVDEEKELKTARKILGSLALTLVVAGCLAGCGSNAQRVTEPDSPDGTQQVASRSSEPAVRVPTEDVAGKEIPGLSRYPGSVRVDHERGQRGGLEMVRARYLTHDGLDAVRGYYRGVFRAKGWEVVNAEFYEDEWTFLATHGDREAHVEIEAHAGGVTGMDIELSEPMPKVIASRETPGKPETTPKNGHALHEQTPSAAPASSSPAPSARASASPAPQSASPAPGYYGDDADDYGDDYGDDGGGDD